MYKVSISTLAFLLTCHSCSRSALSPSFIQSEMQVVMTLHFVTCMILYLQLVNCAPRPQERDLIRGLKDDLKAVYDNPSVIIRNTSVSLFDPVECYPRKSSEWPPPIRADCGKIIEFQLLKSLFAREQFTWSYNKDADKVLPKAGQWSHGTCSIEVINFNREEEDTFSMATIAWEAVNILEQCVETQSNIDGGYQHIGWVAEHFFVAVRAPLPFEESMSRQDMNSLAVTIDR